MRGRYVYYVIYITFVQFHLHNRFLFCHNYALQMYYIAYITDNIATFYIIAINTICIIYYLIFLLYII